MANFLKFVGSIGGHIIYLYPLSYPKHTDFYISINFIYILPYGTYKLSQIRLFLRRPNFS